MTDAQEPPNSRPEPGQDPARPGAARDGDAAKQRVGLVSGSHRGTGAAIAKALAADGLAVAVHGWEAGQADDVVASITESGGRSVAVIGDILTDAGAAAVMDQTQVLGPVDVLVNNYGTPGSTRWGTTPAGEWAQAWERNVMHAARLTESVLPSMREKQWGRVIFLGTVGTAMPGRRNPDYYGAKAALPAIVRSLAQELAGTGVTANLVSPGIIATAEMRELVARRAKAEGVVGDWATVLSPWAATHLFANLVGRIPEPEDIADFVRYVASDAAWAITGADLRIDGGAVDARS